MFWLFVITILGCNLAPLFIPTLDMWHAQGFWVQSGILLLFSWSFFENKNVIKIKNIPLGLLHLWVGLSTLFFCYHFQVKNQYDTVHFFPYFNFLCLIILYNLILSHTKKEQIEKILEYMRWFLIGTCLMCVLQFFDIAQFFQFINSSDPQFPRYWNNLVTGFIGNGTHLSGFLGMCVPLLFLRWKRENLFILILILLILTQTGTNKNDPSASGFAIIICISYYYLYFKNRKAFWWSTLAGLISVSVLFCVLKETTWFIKFIRPTGRMEIWSYYWPLFKKYTITGTGLGTVNQIFKQGIGAPNTRHLHLEYYHFALETGIIGLVLIGNLFKEFFSVKDSGNTTIVLKAIILGFLLNCLFNFPAHLWLPSVYALFAYAGVYTIENERILKYGYFDEERNTGQCIKYNPTGCFPNR